MHRVPEQVTQVSGWLLVCGLAFYSADSLTAHLERRWASDALALPTANVAAIPANAVAEAPPEGLVRLMQTTAPPVDASAPAVAAEGAPSVTPAVPESKVSVRLIGTMAGLGGSGVAMLEVGGESVVASTGDLVKDEWMVVDVGSSSVLLERNGVTLALDLDVVSEMTVSGPAAPATVVSGGPAVVAGAPAGEAPTAAATPDAPLPPAEPLTSRKELLAIMDHPELLSKQGNIKPEMREGEIVGYKIRVKDPAFPLARLGIQTGDVIKSVNGVAANGPEGLSSLYRLLRNTNDFKFEIERAGAASTVQAHLED